MDEEKLERLLKLEEENNKMLKEIKAYVEKNGLADHLEIASTSKYWN